jgi:hypothetical protein
MRRPRPAAVGSSVGSGTGSASSCTRPGPGWGGAQGAPMRQLEAAGLPASGGGLAGRRGGSCGTADGSSFGAAVASVVTAATGAASAPDCVLVWPPPKPTVVMATGLGAKVGAAGAVPAGAPGSTHAVPTLSSSEGELMPHAGAVSATAADGAAAKPDVAPRAAPASEAPACTAAAAAAWAAPPPPANSASGCLAAPAAGLGASAAAAPLAVAASVLRRFRPGRLKAGVRNGALAPDPLLPGAALTAGGVAACSAGSPAADAVGWPRAVAPGAGRLEGKKSGLAGARRPGERNLAGPGLRPKLVAWTLLAGREGGLNVVRPIDPDDCSTSLQHGRRQNDSPSKWRVCAPPGAPEARSGCFRGLQEAPIPFNARR